MNRKKKLGLALIASAIIGAAALHFAGVDIVRVADSEMTDSMTFVKLNCHCSVWLLGGAALVGFICLVTPARKSSA